MKMKNILSVMMISLQVLTSCNDDSDYFKKSDLVTSGNGYIKVNIQGVSKSGVVLNDSFTAEQYPATDMAQQSYYLINGDRTEFEIARYYNYPIMTNYISIDFYKEGDEFGGIYLNIGYQKKLENNKVLNLDTWDLDFNESSEITNFSFDQATGKLKGNYSVTYEFITTEDKPGTLLISGDFDLTVFEVVNK